MPTGRAPLTHLYHSKFALRHIDQFDLFHSHCLAGAPIEGLVDGPESPLSDAIAESLEKQITTYSSAMFQTLTHRTDTSVSSNEVMYHVGKEVNRLVGFADKEKPQVLSTAHLDIIEGCICHVLCDRGRAAHASIVHIMVHTHPQGRK